MSSPVAFHLIFLRQVLSLDLKLANSIRGDDQQAPLPRDPPVSTPFPALGLQIYMPEFRSYCLHSKHVPDKQVPGPNTRFVTAHSQRAQAARVFTHPRVCAIP